MNFLEFEGMIGIGGNSVDLGGVKVDVPAAREGRDGRLTLGVRPEHVKFRDDAAYRGGSVPWNISARRRPSPRNGTRRAEGADLLRPQGAGGGAGRPRLRRADPLALRCGKRQGPPLRGNEGVLGHG
ncbi:hypothetical protein [Shinella granuli]|uniref:hypothetical protein n=1 Tax=Shinella granuli TaxID=323621 RepID=UPI0031E8C2B6